MADKIDFRDGIQVQKFRRKLRLNQAQFWSLFGVTQSGGSRYESGRDIPNPVVKLLTIAFGSKEQKKSILEAFEQVSGAQAAK